MQVAGSEDATPAPEQDGAASLDDLEPISLPEIRTSHRAKRREAKRRAQRQRYMVVAAIAAVVVTAAALLTMDDEDAPSASDRETASDEPAVQRTGPLLLAQTGADGAAVSVTVLVPDRSGRGGTVLLVPPGTMTEVAGLGPRPVASALQTGGESRLRATTQNLLGATIDDTLALDDTGLAELLEPVAPLRITLTERVEQVDEDGLVTVLFEEGPVDLMPADVGPFLAAKGSGTDLVRLARHQSFWSAWLVTLGSDTDYLPDGPPALRSVLEVLAKGNTRVRMLPVESFGSTPEDGELYTASAEEVAKLVEQVFSGDASTGPRARVRVLNGTGELELAQRVTEKLAPADVQVTLTGNAEPFGYDTTQIIYYDPKKREIAEQIRKTLGVGMLVRNRNETGVVDVTIIVGKDFRAE